MNSSSNKLPHHHENDSSSEKHTNQPFQWTEELEIILIQIIIKYEFHLNNRKSQKQIDYSIEDHMKEDFFQLAIEQGYISKDIEIISSNQLIRYFWQLCKKVLNEMYGIDSSHGIDYQQILLLSKDFHEASLTSSYDTKRNLLVMKLLIEKATNIDQYQKLIDSEDENQKIFILVEKQLKPLKHKIMMLEKMLHDKTILLKQQQEQPQQQQLEVVEHHEVKEDIVSTIENQDLVEKMTLLENQLHEITDIHHREIEKIREEKQEAERCLTDQYSVTIKQLEATITKKEQEVEALNNQLDSERTISSMTSSAEKQTFIDKIDDLEAQLINEKETYETKQQSMEIDYKQKINALEQQMKELMQCKEEMKLELDTLQSSLSSAMQENEKIQHEYEQVKLSNAREIEQIKSEHEREVEELKTQLIDQHHQTQEDSLKRASDEAQQQLEFALKEMQENMQVKHEQQLISLRNELKQLKETALNSMRDSLNAEHSAELEEMRKSNQEQMNTQRKQIEQEKNLELETKLKTLCEEKDTALRDAVTSAQHVAAAELQAAENRSHQKLTALQKEVDKSKDELIRMEENHNVALKTALSNLTIEKDKERDDAIAAARADMSDEINAAYSERDEHLANYAKERMMRKKIHNRLLELQGNIRVMCRVRPILEVERKSGQGVDITQIPSEDELVIQRESVNHRSRFEYDRVFSQTSTQEEVFEAVQPLCVSVLDGYNVCIFAYGQTGSGKTYTMEGYGENKGVTPRAIAELLNQVEQMQEQATYTLTLSMLEIYNETILDLLCETSKEKLDIRQTPEGNQVAGLSEVQISSMEQVHELMTKGQRNRAVGSHDMNEHSSRSHSIITIACSGKNHLDGTTSYGKLHLIDLAGSERISKTDATGERLKEAQNINKSLSALGDVINALGNKKAGHVPYRNSKLTFLLQDSLGGNSKVMTFVNISPAVYNMGETICSLNFATRCRTTELGQAKRQVTEDGASSTRPTSLNRRGTVSGSCPNLAATAVSTDSTGLPTMTKRGSASALNSATSSPSARTVSGRR